ncbi:hypothetical protein MG290_04845 [Flavobacterium sp. CBA20B-1]|uniref:Uncharacterized protein n=1 Tax=Paenimyroides aestuarii TaxID=2968490 RepID=A0ABY5NQ36_9FLAO|nr:MULTISPECIES: hypothetical protein [Flavobacteriaceae]UUV20655.1 hypothetical protein NPX36_09890 [Paenimyroides aestuarii]WCM43002.1 hypothetical protein MG290_04845 [Flavobacterium sp. CBA20B-1]
MTERLIHTIKILEKVSFNKDLFIKEFTKAINFLLPFEIDQLKEWIIDYTKNKTEFEEVLALV